MCICRCYRSSYSFRRCDKCLAKHKQEPDEYPLTPAFPSRDTQQLVICNICKIQEVGRSNEAERKRRKKRRESACKLSNQMNARQMEKCARHLRKWRAECVRDNLDPNSKEASRRLSSVKAQSSYYGNQTAWHYFAKLFFKRYLDYLIINVYHSPHTCTHVINILSHLVYSVSLTHACRCFFTLQGLYLLYHFL